MEQLESLEGDLRGFIAITREHPAFPFADHFDEALAAVQEIKNTAFAQSDLNDLAIQILSPFYPKEGGLSDYVPGEWNERTGPYDPFPKAKEFENAKRMVYDSAFELRVIGRR